MEIFVDTLQSLAVKSGFAGFGTGDGYLKIVMILISFVLFYLAIKKQYEPLLMLPIAFGMLLTNLPFSGLYHPELWNPSTNPYFAPEYVEEGMNVLVTYTKEVSLDYGKVLHEGGLDEPVARALAAETVFERAYQPIGDAALERARALMAQCGRVCCPQTVFGPMNEKNRLLRDEARANGWLTEQV